VRSYHQYCGLARALDVVGDRWTLLVIRELLEGPRRYAELLDGLPGIATNLLTERLCSLEENGVVVRRPDGGYQLSPWGEGLHDVVYALGRWASPLMARPLGDDEFRPHWLRHIVVALFEGMDKRRGDLTVELRCGEDPMTLVSTGGRVQFAAGRFDAPDVVLTGRPDAVVGLIAGALRPAEAAAHGVSVTGDARRLSRLRPRHRPS
jgi:DNA-binding HxlR family transcriptional regulator